MGDANALFCVLDWGDKLEPSADAVKQHERYGGGLWVLPGATFSQAADALRDHAHLPTDATAAYLHPRGAWSKVVGDALAHQVEPGVTYCFRLLPPPSAKPRRILPPPPNSRPLHRISCLPVFLNQAKSSFRLFIAKSSTRDTCRRMVSALATISSAADDDEEKLDQLCREFQREFGVCVSCGNEWSKLPSVAAVAVLLQQRDTFVSVMTVKPGCLTYTQSSALRLSHDDDLCLTELGFLFWVAGFVKAKQPDLNLPLDITAVDGNSSKQVRLVHNLRPTFLGSSLVLRASDGCRELVVKIGQSPALKMQLEELCVRAYDQVPNEAAVLRKLQGRCPTVPPLVFSGHWDDKPVMMTELQGSPLDDAWLPLEPATTERLCKELTQTVLELHEQGVAHGDINPKNIGVYAEEASSNGRLFYLYDLGFSLDLPRRCEKQKLASNMLFSATDRIKSGSVSLVTELEAVVLTCLYLAGVELPWQDVLDWGPSMVSDFRKGFAASLGHDPVFLHLSPCFRTWCLFVLRQPSDAAAIRQASAFCPAAEAENIPVLGQ